MTLLREKLSSSTRDYYYAGFDRIPTTLITNKRSSLVVFQPGPQATAKTLQIRAAVNDVTDPEDGNQLGIEAIKVHPGFRQVWNAYWNDIAIVRLVSELDLSGLSVKAVCPPVQQHSGWLHRRIGERGMVASWGSTKFQGPTVDKLRYGEFQAVPTIVCQAYALATYFRPLPSAQILCAHGDGGVVRALCTRHSDTVLSSSLSAGVGDAYPPSSSLHIATVKSAVSGMNK
ncbi:unnamed protein product [Notodromas monacha]|uniref:Peptidase S1 domain-containing protein n=1 Tax=Notodromas monacha TaxID=399045 RepID=A0A7R9BDD5_9CRUS|nr:unnamed protein product [Notodromas monacha]CAG0912703.1 unnamed protein product [Notodromas monacha]